MSADVGMVVDRPVGSEPRQAAVVRALIEYAPAVVVFVGALAYFLLVKGPREYVVPADAPETAPEPEPELSLPHAAIETVKNAAAARAETLISFIAKPLL